MTIPPAYQVFCEFHHGIIDSRADGKIVASGQYIGGWAVNRDDGGPNNPRDKTRFHRWACLACIQARSTDKPEISTVPSVRVTCEIGGCVIEAGSHGNGRYIFGWIVNRESGGANLTWLIEPTNRWACGGCIDRRVDGLENQESLF